MFNSFTYVTSVITGHSNCCRTSVKKSLNIDFRDDIKDSTEALSLPQNDFFFQMKDLKKISSSTKFRFALANIPPHCKTQDQLFSCQSNNHEEGRKEEEERVKSRVQHEA